MLEPDKESYLRDHCPGSFYHACMNNHRAFLQLRAHVDEVPRESNPSEVEADLPRNEGRLNQRIGQ